MYGTIKNHLQHELTNIRDAGLFKSERIITTPQEADIGVTERDGTVINFCANNYQGLANHPRLVQAAKDAVKEIAAFLAARIDR